IGDYYYETLTITSPDDNFDVPYSNCSHKHSCRECPTLGPKKTRIMISDKQTIKETSKMYVVAVMDVHQRGRNQFECGPLNVQSYYQLYALQIALRKGNADSLGLLVIDACSHSIRAVNDIYSFQGGCGIIGETAPIDLKVRPEMTMAYVIMGPDNVDAARAFLTSQEIPIVFPSVAPAAPNKYVFSTMPSDFNKAQLLISILQSLEWTHVMVVSSSSDGSQAATTAFFNAVKNKTNICIGKQIIMGENATEDDARDFVNNLNSTSDARVVVYFTDVKHTELLWSGSDLSQLVWIGFSHGENEAKENSDRVSGSITISPQTLDMRDILNTLVGSRPDITNDIPPDWFEEFWQLINGCKNSSSKFVQKQFTRECGDSEQISSNEIRMDPSVSHTFLAGSILREAALTSECIPGDRNCFTKALHTTSVQVPDATTKFSFNNTLGFEIRNFQSKTKVHVKIGSWDTGAMHLSIDVRKYQGPIAKGGSNCTSDNCPCLKNPVVTFNQSVTVATPSQNEYITTLPAVDSRFVSAIGIIVSMFIGIGVLLTLVLFVVFCNAYPNYKNIGTTLLGYYGLFGVLVIFLHTLAFIYYPSSTVCGFRRFLLGYSYAICFSAFLIKVLDIWRIGKYGDAKYKRVTSPCSLFFVAIGLTLVQGIIVTMWLVQDPPKSGEIIYDGGRWHWCTSTDSHNVDLVMSCIYVMALILMTAIFGVATWKLEVNNRESRWICIAAFLTIGCWVIWTVVSTLAEHKYRDGAIAICNLVNGYVILATVYFRKLWLLAMHKKEKRELAEEHRSVSMNGSSE
ncbi:metabotropic glutamate receptor 3-like, partial [Lingula anatina]|uniref:Metabotropic glutamate receptor 3-like n=1 Tax=Lingula anatina TaxID=7574 RepID=A0A2R2MNE3_LINAN